MKKNLISTLAIVGSILGIVAIVLIILRILGVI